MTNDNTRYELWYSGEGVSITEYDTSSDEPTVIEEWWWTWPELFEQLTGVTGHRPEIHSES